MSIPSETNVEGLLERVRSGDEAALGELLRKYEHRIRLTARYLIRPVLRRYLDSMDVAQSVQFDLMRGLREGHLAPGNPQAFVALAVTIVRRKVAQHWRHIQLERQFNNGSREQNHGSGSRRAAPEDPARTVQQHEDIQTLMRFLDPIERRLVELRLQGHTTEDAAEQLNCSANVLRVRLSRLRKRLCEHGYTGECI